MMPLVEAELLRRAAAGQCAKTLAAEARSLSEWARVTHPDKSPPKAEAIRNKLRNAYNTHVRHTK